MTDAILHNQTARDAMYNARVQHIRFVHDALMIARIAQDDGVPDFQAGQYATLGLGSWEPWCNQPDGGSVSPMSTESTNAGVHAPAADRCHSDRLRLVVPSHTSSEAAGSLPFQYVDRRAAPTIQVSMLSGAPSPMVPTSPLPLTVLVVTSTSTKKAAPELLSVLRVTTSPSQDRSAAEAEPVPAQVKSACRWPSKAGAAVLNVVAYSFEGEPMYYQDFYIPPTDYVLDLGAPTGS